MSEIGAAPLDHDTHLMPILFRDGSDRRRSARIPLATQVRIGPPNGTPYALVSASDLSKGGLFIDADRPVRVGARFSAEIELPSHTKIYVSEAEVAYNRERRDGSGFGVRFVCLDEDALAAVAEEIDRVTDETSHIRSSKKDASELPTLPPARTRNTSIAPSLGVEFSEYPEPEIVDEALELESMIQASRLSERLQAGLQKTRKQFLERAKSAPAVFRVLAITGAIGLVGSAAYAVAQGAGADAVAPAIDPTEHGVAASTHQVLMGTKDSAALDRPSAIEPASIEDPKLRRKLLPPLVVLEEEKVAARPLPPVVKAPVVKAPVAAVKPAPKAEKRDDSDSKIDEAIARLEDKAIAKIDAKRKPSRTLQLGGIDPGARVIKTHLFKAPDRFVIDLAGQKGAIETPAGVRSGRHPDFFRVVIDSPSESARATISGSKLLVTLQ
jgi:hypothetical protein